MLNAVKHLAWCSNQQVRNEAGEMLHCVQHDNRSPDILLYYPALCSI
jgi:hypothetical protein